MSLYIMVRTEVRYMGSKISTVDKSTALSGRPTTRIFTGKIGVYRGNIIKKEHWDEFSEKQGFRIFKHLGVRTDWDKFTMYSYFTSQEKFYQGPNTYKYVTNFRCNNGVFSHINSPICTTSESFESYTEVSYKWNESPKYILDIVETKVITPDKIGEDAVRNYTEAYSTARNLNIICIDKKVISELSVGDLMVCSSLGVLNPHSTKILLKFSKFGFNVEQIEELNGHLVGNNIKTVVCEWL